MRATVRLPHKEGDVIRLTRYGEVNCNVWVVVISSARQNDIGDWAAGGVIICGEDLPTNRDPTTRMLTLDDNDLWMRVVDPPEYVCAELMKWRLMGEPYDMGD